MVSNNEDNLTKRWHRLSSQGSLSSLKSYPANDSLYRHGAEESTSTDKMDWLQGGASSARSYKGDLQSKINAPKVTSSGGYLGSGVSLKGSNQSRDTDTGGASSSKKEGFLSKTLESKKLANGLAVIGTLASIYSTYEGVKYQRGILDEHRKINSEKIASLRHQRSAQSKMQANIDNAWL